MERLRHQPFAAILIFAVALTARLVHVWQIRQAPFFTTLMGDARGYDAWATRLGNGDWFGGEVFYQAPLYPYFLGLIYALAGRDLLVVRVVQAIVGAASCALLGVGTARLFSPGVGLVAGLALALYAPAIFFDGLMQKSVLDVFFVCLALWLIARIAGADPDPPAKAGGYKRLWVALGGTMGALALTRENALIFIAVIVVWAWWQRERTI